MSKTKYILSPAWKWFVTVPLGILTAYNLYRQEINPNAPPMINWLANIFWVIWLLSFFLIISFIVIEGLWRYIKDSEEHTSNEIAINSSTSNGGVALSAREINAPVTLFQTANEATPPNIIVELLDEKELPFQKLTFLIKHLPDKPDIDILVKQKRDELLNKNTNPAIPKIQNTRSPIAGLAPDDSTSSMIEAALSASVGSYKDRVEIFLEEYADYLIDSYDVVESHKLIP